MMKALLQRAIDAMLGFAEYGAYSASMADPVIAELRAAIAAPDPTQPKNASGEWMMIAPDGMEFTGATPFKAAFPATKYRLEIDPVAAAKFAEIIDQIAEEGEAEREQCMRDYGTLDCPACGGSGHIADTMVANPDTNAFAKAIHYPECWDTAAYPTLASALSEVYAWGNCSVCSTPVATTAAQRVTIAEAFANHDWVDDYLNSIAGVIKAAEAVMGAKPCS